MEIWTFFSILRRTGGSAGTHRTSQDLSRSECRGRQGSRSLPELPAIPESRQGRAEPPRQPGPTQHCGACAGRAARPRYQGRRRRAPRPGQAPAPRCPCLPHGRGRAAPGPSAPHSPAGVSSARPPLPPVPSRRSRRDKRQRPQTGSAASARRHFRPAASGSFSNGPAGCPV